MLIDISDAALEQLQELLSDADNEGKGVRILVQPG
jgi:Fe-S cluster assembly iron-binding protein IscA